LALIKEWYSIDKEALFMNNEGLLTESVHLSHWTVLNPLNKGLLPF
jgi:hypothetical protein